MNNSGLSVRGHRVLVLPEILEEKTESGIITRVAGYGDREQMAQVKGVIVSIGNTAWADQIEPWAELGDVVIFAKYSGIIHKGKDGKEYRVISDLDIVGVEDKGN
jgi:co-chaperonin GroES (HSP10)